MASAKTDSIADMVEAAKANMSSRTSTTSTSESSSSGQESEGIEITRHTSDHIQGQAKSGALKKLNGKTVKIQGNSFMVRDHLLNRDDDIETLILTRSLSGKKTKPKRAKTVFEMGYDEPKDIQYNDSDREFASIQLKRFSEELELLKVAFITPDGSIKEAIIGIKGIDWEDPSMFNVTVFEEADDEEGIDKKMDRNFLIRSYLLYHEWIGDFTPEHNVVEEDSTHTEEIEIDIDISDLPDELQELISGFTETKVSSDREEPNQPNLPNLGGLFNILKDIVEGTEETKEAPTEDEFMDYVESRLKAIKKRRGQR